MCYAMSRTICEDDDNWLGESFEVIQQRASQLARLLLRKILLQPTLVANLVDELSEGADLELARTINALFEQGLVPIVG